MTLVNIFTKIAVDVRCCLLQTHLDMLGSAEGEKMKTVKLNFAGVSDYFDKENNTICYHLKRNGYKVEISDDPDYLVCDVWLDHPFEYCGKPQVRIMVSGENYIPDFNLIDYAISPYPISFADRHFHRPGCAFHGEHWYALSRMNRNYNREILDTKVYFANFITSHESEFNIRGDFFKQLCKYKRVESAGTYLNNMPNGETVNWLNSSKSEFQRKCKFTLCFESTLHHGFVTEKLTDAFFADTIPVYYGSSAAADIFNKDAFINVAEFASFEEAIQKIIELDQDDEKYLQMLSQPVLRDREYPQKLDAALGDFICQIFDQPLEKAYRRSRVYLPRQYDMFLARAVDSDCLTVKNLLKRLGLKTLNKIGIAPFFTDSK